MKYRSRTEIASRILESAAGGSTKTKIMYKAFLSYAQLQEYLLVLEENGLLAHDKGEQLYRTTEKGQRFLNITNSLQGMMESIPGIQQQTQTR
ncbi:MAG TPA: winged helix-turn-helix domain-containing protein [Nitrososphaera sp.]|nr:winged helix-turn-helix domain-containing protein [Nitrososphaera sp.]